MVPSSTIGNLAARFAPYIGELRELFHGRKLPCGQPEDVRSLADRLADPDFHEEMSSMVRSILYRESEAVPRVELMEVLAIAAGGPGIHDPALDLHEPMKRLMEFVTEVARSQRNGVPREADLASADELDAAPLLASAPDQNLPVVREPGRPSSDLQDRENAEPRSINDRLSQALSYSHESEEELDRRNQEAATPVFRQIAPTEDEAAPALAFVPDRSASTRGASGYRRLYWIPGVLLLLIAIGLVWSMRHGPAAPAQREAASSAPAQSASQKPSPYIEGPASRGTRMHHSESDRSSASLAGDAATTTAAVRPVEPGKVTEPALNGSTERHAGNTSFKVRGGQSANLVIPTHSGGREGVFLASSGVMAGHLLFAPAPSYPKLAALARVEGEVIVQVVVGREGEVEATRVLQGPRLLRSAAEHAVRRWRYRPYTVEGRPTDVATIVTVSFRLHR